ncbi:DUF1365 domain-containing protein [Chromohalobacter sarecensis]|uniref:DUF1365 domain-containing protein n=1 Tax=Chromohalobacter sarecensis TaxID=245294 RepID=A0ABV9CYC7_9GAMM|nr:DUF1365 domain-containing protein [Chromohalobacter sarecensis]MCK0716123.1 DUF1365 domain-containing protein [Chromohalobacter sarecensis]
MSALLHSRVARGELRHRRFTPRAHHFTYRVWMAWIDLDELPELFDRLPGFSARRAALARFRREDYLGPTHLPLKTAVHQRLRHELGEAAPTGPVRMLTQLRLCGVLFNPITLYYAYDHDERLCAILGEVTNTPWQERHVYAYPVTPTRHVHAAHFDKALHVSPFNPMDMRYRWRFNTPGEYLLMHMEVWREATRHFDATLSLRFAPAGRRAWVVALARAPWMSLKTLAGIHFEALRLWLKRVPLFSHSRGEETRP